MLESLFATDREAFWRTAGEVVGKCDPFILCQVLAIAYRSQTMPRIGNALVDRISSENRLG